MQILGVGAAVLGDMSSRPNWGLNELDFVFSTLIVGSLMNFSLMYLLAPTGAATGRLPGNAFARLFDERSLTRMGAPGGHIFERGFSLQSRALNLVFKSVMFGVIGFLAGLAGTCISNGLIGVRKLADPKYVTQNESPDVFLNSLAWTIHMGASSNIRYQILNGMDMVRYPTLPTHARTSTPPTANKSRIFSEHLAQWSHRPLPSSPGLLAQSRNSCS